MDKITLQTEIDGKQFEFDSEEITTSGDLTRRFRVTDLTSDHILYKDLESGIWKQEDIVEFDKQHLEAVGRTLTQHYQL